MRAVVQRVSKASVTVDGKIISKIETGLLVLLGIEDTDTQEDIEWLSKRVANLRIFNDENGVMNKSIIDIEGKVLLISQFTLYASTKKGNRPSYIKAAKPPVAVPLYKKFIQQIEGDMGRKVETGVFGADMKVELLNDGPVTIVIDTKNRE
jgi:D-tyrosyl-tRNA(Tyr) deacylase